jgi:hypothetical protein
MMKFRNLLLTSFSVLALLGSMTHAPLSASATSQNGSEPVGESPAATSTGYQTPKVSRVLLPFDHAVSFSDAEHITETLSEPVLAYRFENPQIVGEFTPQVDWTADQFLTNFKLDWGTEPEISGLVVERPTPQQESRVAPIAPIVTGRPELVAPLAAGPKVDAFEASRMSSTETERSEVSISALPNEWRPASVQVMIQKYPGDPGVHFSQFANWQSGTSPGNLNSNFGWEMEVNLANPNMNAGYRPACQSNFKDQFFAKNYSWYSWSVFNSDYSSIAATTPYADYNDLGDSCSKQSIAVGMKNPQSMPTSPNNPPYALALEIHAPSGTVSTNTISALWQTVTKTYCNRFPGNTMSLTDCMGVDQTPYPDSNTFVRPVLADWRKYVAPDRCWFSENYGNNDPWSPFPGSGC